MRMDKSHSQGGLAGWVERADVATSLSESQPLGIRHDEAHSCNPSSSRGFEEGWQPVSQSISHIHTKHSKKAPQSCISIRWLYTTRWAPNAQQVFASGALTHPGSQARTCSVVPRTPSQSTSLPSLKQRPGLARPDAFPPPQNPNHFCTPPSTQTIAPQPCQGGGRTAKFSHPRSSPPSSGLASPDTHQA